MSDLRRCKCKHTLAQHSQISIENLGAMPCAIQDCDCEDYQELLTQAADRTQPTEAQGDDAEFQAWFEDRGHWSTERELCKRTWDAACNQRIANLRNLHDIDGAVIKRCIAELAALKASHGEAMRQGDELYDQLMTAHVTLKASQQAEIEELKAALASERDYVNTHIAAAEAAHLAELAKVRLEEVHNCKPVECRLPAHIPFRWPACSACQSMARWEERIAILEAAK